MNLLEDRIATLLRRIHKVYYTAFKMSQGCNRLHLNCVHLLELVVQNPRRVDNLVAEVFVVSVTHIEGLSGEGVWLDLDIGLAHTVDKARFAHIRISSKENRPFIGVDGGKPAHMSSDLLQIRQRRPNFPDHGTNASHCSSL